MRNLITIVCLFFSSLPFIFISCNTENEFERYNSGLGTDLTNFHVVIGDNLYYPADTSGQDLTVFVPEGVDLSNIRVSFSHNSKNVSIDGSPCYNSRPICDFSDFKNGTQITLYSANNESKVFFVRVLDTHLPILSITTNDHDSIVDKINWKQAKIKVYEVGGGENDYEAEVRGRGNQTWVSYPKKPYTIKLNKKKVVLGMPKGKRWDLLALYRGYIGNAFAFEAARRAPAIEWSPSGKFVEMVLNGKYQGLYYLCEHIKIDKERINIAELKTEDVNYPEVSGGYLLECDELYDEDYKFMSSYFNMPYMIKSPDENVPDEQFDYIRTYINDLEAELMKLGTNDPSHYEDYLDVDNFADYWMALEMVNNYEAFKPRSVKMYKGRDGVDSPSGTVCKLKAGPLWDQEVLLMDFEFYSLYSHYFYQLFKDDSFVNKVKERWECYKTNIIGNNEMSSLLDYTTSIYDDIKMSADRDGVFWANPYSAIEAEYDNVASKLDARIDWMDRAIKNMQPIN